MCPSGHLCTCPDKGVRRGYQGVLRNKTNSAQATPRDSTVVSKREKQMQSGISLDKSRAEALQGKTGQSKQSAAQHVIHLKERRELVKGRKAKKWNQERLDPYPVPESREIQCNRERERERRRKGVSVVVRSNKCGVVSLLFRHSIVAVVEGGVFPPHLRQWSILAQFLWMPRRR